MWFAPSPMATAGEATRFWSSAFVPVGRTPGVTINLPFASGRARIMAASCGLAITPSAPARNARRARSCTSSWISPFRIRARSRSPRSIEVNMVTARIFRSVSPRPATAARTTFGSPWTVRKSRSNCASPATAFSTVCPMSNSFMSRNTRLPISVSSFASAKPPPVSIPKPIL